MTTGSRAGLGIATGRRRTLANTIESFRARADEARSIVHELAAWDEVAALAITLAGDGRVALTRTLAAAEPELVARLGARALLPDPGAPAGGVADVAVGIVRGEVAIAETGSVLLFEADLADRCVSMLSQTLVQVVQRAAVLNDLDALAEQLLGGGPPVYASLTTGPSRTADIERSLTIGVQGPAEVHVVILG